ncbi:hypothetical protein N8858_00450 [Flavobacteriaceae bacterium]|nr:hypothetical protein [Flavobacteriaceae bacterium]
MGELFFLHSFHSSAGRVPFIKMMRTYNQAALHSLSTSYFRAIGF